LDESSAKDMFAYCNFYYVDGAILESNGEWCDLQVYHEVHQLLLSVDDRWCPDYQSSKKWKLEFLAYYNQEATVKDVMKKVLNRKHTCKQEKEE